MVALRTCRLGGFAVLLLGQQHRWASGESTCTSVIVSGVDFLDGTYEYQSTGYYTRSGGPAFYELERSGDLWYLKESTNTIDPQYRTYDAAEHPADISSEWAECAGLITVCDDFASDFQPVITCAEDPTTDDEPEPSTCTSVVVSGVDFLDGTYEYESSGYYTRSGGTSTYEIERSGDLWYLMESTKTIDPQYRTYDPAEHPADVALEWAECTGTSFCDDYASDLQPVITCAGSPTPSSTPNTSDDDSETPSPAGAEGDGTTVDDGEGDGDNEGLSTGAIVGIIAAVLGLIGGGLILKFNNNNCFSINKTSVQVHNTEA